MCGPSLLGGGGEGLQLLHQDLVLERQGLDHLLQVRIRFFLSRGPEVVADDRHVNHFGCPLPRRRVGGRVGVERHARLRVSEVVLGRHDVAAGGQVHRRPGVPQVVKGDDAPLRAPKVVRLREGPPLGPEAGRAVELLGVGVDEYAVRRDLHPPVEARLAPALDRGRELLGHGACALLVGFRQLHALAPVRARRRPPHEDRRPPEVDVRPVQRADLGQPHPRVEGYVGRDGEGAGVGAGQDAEESLTALGVEIVHTGLLGDPPGGPRVVARVRLDDPSKYRLPKRGLQEAVAGADGDGGVPPYLGEIEVIAVQVVRGDFPHVDVAEDLDDALDAAPVPDQRPIFPEAGRLSSLEVAPEERGQGQRALGPDRQGLGHLVQVRQGLLVRPEPIVGLQDLRGRPLRPARSLGGVVGSPAGLAVGPLLPSPDRDLDVLFFHMPNLTFLISCQCACSRPSEHLSPPFSRAGRERPLANTVHGEA